MAICPACGGDVDWIDAEGGGGRVPLDKHETVAPPRDGEKRYVVRNGLAAPVAVQSSIPSRGDHRTTCPRRS